MQNSPTLKKLANDLWVVERPLNFMGLELGTKMTLIRLKDGSLWLHSPIDMGEELAQKISELGPVKYVVAPNTMHHLFVSHIQNLFPQVKTYAAKGLQKKRKDLKVDSYFGEDFTPSWEGLRLLNLQGLRYLDEVVFYHESTQSLILTDLAMNIQDPANFWTKWACQLLGVNKRLGCPLEVKLFFLANRMQFCESLAIMESWPFQRIIMPHGQIIEDQAKTRFREAFSFLREKTGDFASLDSKKS